MRSMTRLVLFLLTLAALAVVVAVCVYALRGSPSAAIITALVGALTAIVANGAVAIIKRNGGTETDTQ